MDNPNAVEHARLEARLAAFLDLKEEFEPWVMEEREVSAREALENVVAHLDAEIIEMHRQLEELS